MGEEADGEDHKGEIQQERNPKDRSTGPKRRIKQMMPEAIILHTHQRIGNGGW